MQKHVIVLRFFTGTSKPTGFTLIELLVAVVVVGILAAIAIPSYQEYILKSRRVDARETLTRMATQQERFFFQYSRYSSDADLTEFGGKTSTEGWYTIDMTHPGGGCGGDEPCNNFTLTATPVGAQLKDTKCQSFSIDQTLKQEAKNANNNDSEVCW